MIFERGLLQHTGFDGVLHCGPLAIRWDVRVLRGFRQQVTTNRLWSSCGAIQTNFQIWPSGEFRMRR